jgi:hypothetical protein
MKLNGLQNHCAHREDISCRFRESNTGLAARHYAERVVPAGNAVKLRFIVFVAGHKKNDVYGKR